MFYVSALLLNDALKPATPLTIAMARLTKMLQQFATRSASTG